MGQPLPRMVSLNEYLRRPNPTIRSIPDDDKNAQGTTTKNRSWVFPQMVKRWKHFRLDAFDAVYGVPFKDVLDKASTLKVFPEIPEFPFCDIRDENSLETLLTLSVQSIVSEALDVVQARLKAEHKADHEAIYMGRGGQAAFEPIAVSAKKDKHKLFRPDWAGMLRPEPSDSGKGKLILPGETKLARCFTSGKIKTGNIEAASERPAWLWPLGQIFTYCQRAQARYGYLITNEELVVIRLRPTDPTFTQPDLKLRHSDRHEGSKPSADVLAAYRRLEFKSIPWKHESKSDTLTVALTLFFLHMIAARNGSLVHGDYAHASQLSTADDYEESSDGDDLIDSQESQTPTTSFPTAVDSPELTKSFTYDTRQDLSRATIDEKNRQRSPTMGGKEDKKRKNDDKEEKNATPKRRRKKHS